MSIKIDISHQQLPDYHWVEIRCSLSWTLSELKSNLCTKIGASDFTVIELTNINGELLGKGESTLFPNPTTTLSQLPNIGNGCCLKITGGTGLLDALDSPTPETDVPKYRISDDVYLQRSNVVQQIKTHKQMMEQKGFKCHDDSKKRLESLESLEAAKKRFPLNSRCGLGDGKTLRGVVAYVGLTGPREPLATLATAAAADPLAGIWIGVHLDEQLGNTDGIGARDKRLFKTSGPRDGIIVPASFVSVGDEFVPLGFDLNDDDDDEI